MPATQTPPGATTEAAIFGRVWDSAEHGLTPELARHVLELRFSTLDLERMRALAERNREASLSADEADELDNYIRVGDLVAILQSKARKVLKKSPEQGGRRG